MATYNITLDTKKGQWVGTPVGSEPATSTAARSLPPSPREASLRTFPV